MTMLLPAVVHAIGASPAHVFERTGSMTMYMSFAPCYMAIAFVSCCIGTCMGQANVIVDELSVVPIRIVGDVDIPHNVRDVRHGAIARRAPGHIVVVLTDYNGNVYEIQSTGDGMRTRRCVVRYESQTWATGAIDWFVLASSGNSVALVEACGGIAMLQLDAEPVKGHAFQANAVVVGQERIGIVAPEDLPQKPFTDGIWDTFSMNRLSITNVAWNADGSKLYVRYEDGRVIETMVSGECSARAVLASKWRWSSRQCSASEVPALAAREIRMSGDPAKYPGAVSVSWKGQQYPGRTVGVRGEVAVMLSESEVANHRFDTGETTWRRAATESIVIGNVVLCGKQQGDRLDICEVNIESGTVLREWQILQRKRVGFVTCARYEEDGGAGWALVLAYGNQDPKGDKAAELVLLSRKGDVRSISSAPTDRFRESLGVMLAEESKGSLHVYGVTKSDVWHRKIELGVAP